MTLPNHIYSGTSYFSRLLLSRRIKMEVEIGWVYLFYPNHSLTLDQKFGVVFPDPHSLPCLVREIISFFPSDGSSLPVRDSLVLTSWRPIPGPDSAVNSSSSSPGIPVSRLVHGSSVRRDKGMRKQCRWLVRTGYLLRGSLVQSFRNRPREIYTYRWPKPLTEGALWVVDPFPP